MGSSDLDNRLIHIVPWADVSQSFKRHLDRFSHFLLTFFRQLSRLRRNERILVEIVVFETGWVTLSINFRGKGVSINDFWRQKTRVPGLSRGVVCVILRFAGLKQYRRVTHRQTHRQIDTRWLLPAHR